MKSPFAWFIVLIAIAAAGAGGYWYGHRTAAAPEPTTAEAPSTRPAEKTVVATVTTSPILRTTISEELIAYGTVIAQPGEIKITSVPYETRVGHMMVTAGQPVQKGTPLVTVDPSPDAQLQLREADNGVNAAKTTLQQTQQRFTEKLATNQDLSTAQQALQSAELKLESLKSRGIGSSRELKAEAAGVVSKVDVQEGQIVPAGGPLVDVIVENRIEVRLGVEPSASSELKPKQPVQLYPVSSATTQPLNGTIRLVTQTVNPDTRLVDVFASIPSTARLMMAEYVRGHLTIASHEALVVPRSAVLPGDDGHYILYTIEAGHAVMHTVELGLKSADQVEVRGEGLKEGQTAVIQGNYELENGMAVEIAPPEPTTAPTTSPATAPTTAPMTQPEKHS